MTCKALNLKILISMSLLLSACSPDLRGRAFSDLKDSFDGIFSTRPQNRTQFIALYRLSNPALLEGLKAGEKVDSARVADIEKEQAEFVAQAQKISPDIKVIYKYKLVINAVTLMAPLSAEKALGSISGLSQIEKSGAFSRPENIITLGQALGQGTEDLQAHNSVKYIGAEKVHEEGLRGQGMKVGIIDTGVDFTHAMLGGPGTVEAYKSVDPNLPNALFPNKKVVGGIDLVGTDFDSASDNFEKHIPHVDANPMDEAGHGSHVAGTVAGIGDGVKSYSGVAPEASLYGIKVFGAEGSTSDEVVIAGLEYAADPNGDLDLSDRLDVVNMSLGSTFGTPHIFYALAIKNLSGAGTVVVASAGNSGATQHIVGAPSVAEEAISVAASVDDADHNWKFGAVRFKTVSQPSILTEAVESPIAKPIAESDSANGTLVFVGLAAVDFPEETVAKVKGHVALIDRGQVTFAEKMTRAEKAGAIGVVVVNSQDGAPFAMGGSGQIGIPAIMISKALGAQLKAEMEKGDVSIEFKTSDKIEKPELIDTLTDFSSQGPRSLDSLIKPEISAPGLNVISAKLGAGDAPTSMSGTSMAGPHIAGVMALLKQAYPTLTSRELKSILMGTSVSIKDEKKQIYPISRQGAGRVQVDQAAHATLVSDTVSLSLGEVQLDKSKVLERELDLKSLNQKSMSLKMKFEGSQQLVLADQNVVLNEAGFSHLKLSFRIDSQKLSAGVNEVGGLVKFFDGDKEVHRIPVLAMVRLVSDAHAKQLTVSSTSIIDSYDSPAQLTLANQDSQKAEILLFNSLGFDTRKEDSHLDPLRSRACDLQAAGYRIVDGKLEVAIKTYEPMTSWNLCEVSVQFDNNADGVADQELVGVPLDHIEGMNGSDLKSVLLDASQARQIRKEYESKVMAGEKNLKVNYSTAVLAMDELTVYPHSTVAVVRMSLSDLKLSATGEFSLKIATTNTEDYSVQTDDFLGKTETRWKKLDSTESGQAYVGLPALVKLDGISETKVQFKKGQGLQDLLVLMPTNTSTLGSLQLDRQLQIIKPVYKVDTQN